MKNTKVGYKTERYSTLIKACNIYLDMFLCVENNAQEYTPKY